MYWYCCCTAVLCVVKIPPRHGTSFSARFPLSPELWQEWIDDRRAAGGDDATEDVLVLYRQAFSDYQCAKLWPGYLEALEESLDVSVVDCVYMMIYSLYMTSMSTTAVFLRKRVET